MPYIHRSLERKVRKLTGFFKVLLVSGARQVGKTTMLQQLADGNRTYVSLDDADVREKARNNPKSFFQEFQPPIIIGEVQYAPQLFPYIKILADNTNQPGQIWLTRAQHYAAIRHVQESLAGRVGLLRMLPLSQPELRGVPDIAVSAYTFESWTERAQIISPQPASDIFYQIWQGGMPSVQDADAEIRAEFFDAYINTYLLRDVGELGGVQDMERFQAFLAQLAKLTGQQINYATLAKYTGVSESIAKQWLKLLEGLGVIYLLRPFATNPLKRLVRMPKLYFADTGLASFLTDRKTAVLLRHGPTSGALLENYVVMEFVKQYAHSPLKAGLFYYRSKDGKEIDLVIEDGDVLHPIEIKQSASPDPRDTHKFSVLDLPGCERGGGGIVYLGDRVFPLSEQDSAIPASIL